MSLQAVVSKLSCQELKLPEGHLTHRHQPAQDVCPGSASQSQSPSEQSVSPQQALSHSVTKLSAEQTQAAQQPSLKSLRRSQSPAEHSKLPSQLSIQRSSNSPAEQAKLLQQLSVHSGSRSLSPVEQVKLLQRLSQRSGSRSASPADQSKPSLQPPPRSTSKSVSPADPSRSVQGNPGRPNSHPTSPGLHDTSRSRSQSLTEPGVAVASPLSTSQPENAFVHNATGPQRQERAPRPQTAPHLHGSPRTAITAAQPSNVVPPGHPSAAQSAAQHTGATTAPVSPGQLGPQLNPAVLPSQQPWRQFQFPGHASLAAQAAAVNAGNGLQWQQQQQWQEQQNLQQQQQLMGRFMQHPALFGPGQSLGQMSQQASRSPRTAGIYHALACCVWSYYEWH